MAAPPIPSITDTTNQASKAGDIYRGASSQNITVQGIVKSSWKSFAVIGAVALVALKFLKR